MQAVVQTAFPAGRLSEPEGFASPIQIITDQRRYRARKLLEATIQLNPVQESSRGNVMTAELATPPAVEPSSENEDFSDRTWSRGPEG